MSETIRYSRIGKEDLNLGTGTFEARLADGRVVTLSQIDLGEILSDPALSSQSISLSSLALVTLSVTGTAGFTGTLQLPEKADPGSPVSGEVWINSAGTFLEYAGDEGTPTKHQVVGHDTIQTLTNKTLDTPTIQTPVLSGTATGTYTLAGTGTLTSPSINSPIIASPVLSGTATGSYTLAGTPTINAPTIGNPTFSGTANGTYTLAGTPTISSTINLTSGRIKFPAVEQPISDVHTLDAYEEGTWVPVLDFVTTGNLSVAYTTQTGTYTKIGNVVHLTGTILTSSFTHTSASGNLKITGLPFLSLTGGMQEGALRMQGWTKANYTQVTAQIDSTTAVMNVGISGSGQAVATMATGDMPTGGTVRMDFNITYIAAL